MARTAKAQAKELESFGRGTEGVMMEVHMDRKRGNRHGLQEGNSDKVLEKILSL